MWGVHYSRLVWRSCRSCTRTGTAEYRKGSPWSWSRARLRKMLVIEINLFTWRKTAFGCCHLLHVEEVALLPGWLDIWTSRFSSSLRQTAELKVCRVVWNLAKDIFFILQLAKTTHVWLNNSLHNVSHHLQQRGQPVVLPPHLLQDGEGNSAWCFSNFYTSWSNRVRFVPYLVTSSWFCSGKITFLYLWTMSLNIMSLKFATTKHIMLSLWSIHFPTSCLVKWDWRVVKFLRLLLLVFNSMVDCIWQQLHAAGGDGLVVLSRPVLSPPPPPFLHSHFSDQVVLVFATPVGTWRTCTSYCRNTQHSPTCWPCSRSLHWWYPPSPLPHCPPALY